MFAKITNRLVFKTIDQLFTQRRLSELYMEFGKTLYLCYVDFQKAFDSVQRLGL